jgi:tRNA (uracil-5-)-methyltransferase
MVVRKAKGTGEILVALSASTQPMENETSFVEILERFSEMLRGLAPQLLGTLAGVLWVQNDGLGDVVAGTVQTLYGRDYVMETLYGLQFKVPLYSFFQTNTRGAEKLYAAAIDQISNFSGKVCFDLFSGTGTIGQILASRGAKHVIGVELIEDAVRSAQENAALNGLSNCEFIAGDVFKVLSNLEDSLLPDVIVLDPPRVGVGENAVRKVASYGVEEIVYVSCNPKTLVEDLKIFEALGYAVGDVTAVDMFPWTGHVETVVLLSRVDK